MPLPSRRTVLAVDLLVAVWVALCVGLGVWLASEIRDLRTLTDTLATSGEGIENTGEALGGLPAVVGGDDVRQVAGDARESGRQAQASATEARGTLERISTLAGATLALVPTGAVLLFYVPLRLAWRRAARSP